MEVKEQACFKFNVINSSWRNKVCEAVVVHSCTYFSPSSCITLRIFVFKALSQFVQFVGNRVRLLECSPTSCPDLRNHCEEKREKYIARRINSKSPSLLSFDTGTVLNFEKPARAHFFHLGEWKIVSFEEKHLCLKERPFQVIFQELWKYFDD